MAEDKTRIIGYRDRENRIPGGTGVGSTARVKPSEADEISTIPAGTLLVHTYRIERLLGSGGMGEVYLAHHTGLNTTHAVKVIRPSLFENRRVLDLFRREATVLRGVRHDAVVSYDGFFSDEHGREYLVMEYARGPSLSERLRRAPLTLEETLALRDRLAHGLAEAHRKGAVHRDISPDNIILPNDRLEEAKLIDFGLCKLTDPTQQTIIGSAFAGKFRFASPEQLGLFEGRVDSRSDIYSLGLVLAAAAIGRPLDMGNSFDAVLRARKSVPDLSRLPEPLREQVTAMLQPDPSLRPQTLAELVSRWPAPSTAPATPVKDPGPAAVRTAVPRSGEGPGTAGRLGWVPVLVVLLLVLLAAGLYWVLRPLDVSEPKNGSEGVEEPDGPGPRTRDELAGLPWEAIEPYFREYLARGHMDDAFALVQGMVVQGHALPVEQTYRFAQDLIALGRTDEAFALLRELAGGGHGPSALALGEMYDPVLWVPATSPFSRPNPRQAERWYQRALEQGGDSARDRLDRLEDWKRREGALDSDAR